MEGVTSEIEIKARIHSVEGCLEQLAKLSKTGAYDYVDKRDVYYVHRKLDHEESLFRLRQYSDGKAEVTRKQKGFSGDMEVNQEIEYGVSDPKAFRQFCESLGFEVLVEKHKHGNWANTEDNILIEVVEVDRLGAFIELEILLPPENEATDEAVEEARGRLYTLLKDFGVPADAVEPRYYIDMLLERTK